jgi:hypothetical protein
MQLTNNINIEYALAAIASANNTDEDTTVFDMSGFDGAVFITPVVTGGATGVATLNVKGHTANAAAGSTITGATATITDGATYAGKNLIVDVYKPLKRYIYGNVTSGTDVITFGATQCIRYKGKMGPLADPSTLADLAAVIGS